MTIDLADFLSPAPREELDPDADGGLLVDDSNAAAAAGAGDEQLAALTAAAAGRRAIRAPIALEGGAYRGIASSRAALFGDGDDGGDDEADGTASGSGSGSDSDGEQAADSLPPNVTRVGRLLVERPPADVAPVPTMFANGHARHVHGGDEPTSSSSSEEEEDEDSEVGAGASGSDGDDGLAGGAQQQLRQRQRAHAGADGREQQQQQQQQQSSSDDDEPGSSSEMQDEQQEQEQQQGPAGSDDDDDGGSSDGDDGLQQQRGVRRGGLPGYDEEMDALEREAAAARAEADAQLLAAGERGSRDASKAAGVRAQKRLWGAALGLRIRLQRALAGANVLPRPAAHAALVAADGQVAARFGDLRASCAATLEQLLELHHALAQQHPAAAASLAAAQAPQGGAGQQPVTASAAGRGAKRARPDAADADGDGDGEAGGQARGRYAGACATADAAWSAVEGVIDGLAGFRDASLDKWHRRTVLSSGTAALRGSSGLRALQQSISSQVSSLMGDKAKLISRSQLLLSVAPRPLGQPPHAQQAAAADGEGADADGADCVAPDPSPSSAAAPPSRERDPETYDEGDHYGQLLKELLESAPGGAHLPAGQLAGARPAKRRRVVDRRASKGRKLRYAVMDKLVGFATPSELTAPPFADNLFANLFGDAAA